MAGLMNKRAIARNERALQDLLKQPGNDRCADCFTRNPGWASWNIGIFLCVRCASLHRKLGTHISKVKSLSMDSWNQDQVESMKRTGNILSNRKYNPRAQNPNIPIDADEIDSAMERFIREKYQHKTLSGEGRPLPSIRHQTGNSDSSNDIPPPLPPKNAPRMAPTLRSQSSTYPSHPSLPSPPASDWSSSHSRAGQVRRMGGIPEGDLESSDAFDVKLDRLRDMGFGNSSRNATILKGCAGDLNKAVDTLTRLGEGYGNVLPKAKSNAQQANGISFEASVPLSSSFSPQATGNSGTQLPSNTAPTITNPFFQTQGPAQDQVFAPLPQPDATGLDQSFQNMDITAQPPSDRRFPHMTATWPIQQAQTTGNPFMKTFTPPISPAPNQSYGVPPPKAPIDNANPFLRSPRSQTLPSSNPFGNPQLGAYVNGHQGQGVYQQAFPPAQDFFGDVAHHRPQPVQSPGFIDHYSQAHQPQNNRQLALHQPIQQDRYQVQQQQIYAPSNGYVQGYASSLQTPYLTDQQQAFAQNGGNMQHPTYRDKNSIMALYNNLQQQQPAAGMQAHQTMPQAQFNGTGGHGNGAQQPQRSVTMPIAASTTNPFAGNGAGPIASGHISRESMLFTGQTYPGRSASPDAFSGLSARQG